MASVIEPPKPPALSDDGPLKRVHFRLWQVTLTAITVLLTAWFFTFGPIPGVIALLVAKHVLVAILAMGLHLPGPPK